ncbi:MAG TPA: NAD-dependent epimerase/dehydratase family protein [Steroidobacteraceae bacterium]|jgi:2'-hydroxyisoflavone reductase|nr:NAD-dependent epimerase/dehydratase family protein [Steroidobacteraceae bacterium]
MHVQRRDALKILAGATLAGLANPVFAKAKALKVLILGGTGFIGPHFVKALTDGGHKVTLFNRGKRDPEVHPGIEQLLGDRDGQVDSLKGRDWDVCIDNSGYKPSQVKLSGELLEDHVKQYIFISSIAVYADFAKAGVDEDYKLATLKDPTTEVVTGETYGGLKVLCEKLVESIYGKRGTIIRPTYIAGPGDHTDRFTYWPFRVSKGGEMLAPGTPSDPFQYIDVRDLADFIRVCVEKNVTGKFNLCGPQGAVTIGSLLDESKRITQANTTFVWASADFLKAQQIIGDEAKGNYMPIWQPPQGDEAGLLLVSPARAVKKGLKFRSLETTIRETLEWQKTRPEDKQVLKAGLTMEREAELLVKLRAA